MPRVVVVPVYVEVPCGFERALATLESHLRRAGYAFCTGTPLLETLEQTKEGRLKNSLDANNDGEIGTRISP